MSGELTKSFGLAYGIDRLARRVGRGRLVLLASAALITAVAPLRAAVLTYDPNMIPAAPTDGPGNWDTIVTDTVWSNLSDPSGQSPNSPADVVWPNSGSDTAIFGAGNGGTAGTVTVASGGTNVANITFNAVSAGAYNITGGTVTLGGTGTDTITTNSAAATATEITSVLAGTPGAVDFAGTGTLTMVPTAQSYNASTTITNTTIAIGKGQNADVSLPFGVAGTTLTLNGATINGSGSGSGGSISYQTPYNIIVQGNNTISTGKSFTLGNTNSTLYTVSGSGNLSFSDNSNGNDSNIRSSFSGTGASEFTGTLTLSASVASGFLRLYGNGGNFTGVPNGTLDLEGSPTVLPQDNTGGNTFLLGALSGASTAAILEGSTTAGAATFSVGALGSNTSFAGTIINGSGAGGAALTLTGGSLTLTNAGNTYTGATNVTGGTLYVNGKTTASTTTVGTSGTLSGTGSIGTAATAGAVTVNGTITAGTSSAAIGTLSLLDGLVFGATGIYSDNIDNLGNSDLLAVTGNISFGAGDILNVNAPSGTSGGTYTIATYTGTETGTFATPNLPAGYTINYGTGSNSSITLVPVSVPEPASASLLALSAVGLLARRRRSAALV